METGQCLSSCSIFSDQVVIYLPGFCKSSSSSSLELSLSSLSPKSISASFINSSSCSLSEYSPSELSAEMSCNHNKASSAVTCLCIVNTKAYFCDNKQSKSKKHQKSSHTGIQSTNKLFFLLAPSHCPSATHLYSTTKLNFCSQVQ